MRNDLKNLSDIAIITMGQSPKGNTYNSDSLGKSLLNGPTEFGPTHPNCTLYTTDSKRECRQGDLIFCVRGSTTGRMNWADKIYSLGRGVCSISGKNKASTKYIYYCIQYYLEHLLKLAGGGTFPNLTKDTINNFPIPFPNEFKKIASVLSNYDNLIENNTRRIQILEEMAQRIYKEWFMDFKYPNHQNDQMVDSELGLIPDGWEVIEISEKFKTVLGGTPSRKNEDYWINGTVPWINSSMVNELRVIDHSELITEDALKQSSTKLMPSRTTILAITGATLGQISLLEKEVCANQSVVGVYDENKTFNEFIYMTLSHIIKRIVNRASGGAQQHINKEIVNSVKIICPIQNVVVSFNKIIIPIFDEIKNMLLKNRNLRQTRDLLLPKLISGKIDVSDLDIDTSILND